MRPSAGAPPAAAPGRPADLVRLATIVAAAAICMVLTRNVVLNHLYVIGSSSDTAWHAGLIWRGNWWLQDAPSMGTRSYFGTHFAPFLILPTLVTHLLWIDAGPWTAWFIGLCYGASALIVGSAMMTFFERRLYRPALVVLLVVAGTVTTFVSPVGIQMAATPHYEILIPSLVIGVAAALALDHRFIAAGLAVVLLSTKEDAGFHLAALLVVYAAAIWIRERRVLGPELTFAAIAIAYSAFAFSFAPFFMPYYQGHMVGYFIGNPPFGHWRLDLIARKVDYFFWQNTYVWGPMMLLALAAARRRDLGIAVGAIAVLPWFVLTVCFASYETVWVLGYHYAFPAMIAIAWPTVLGLYRTGPRGFAGGTRWFLWLQAGTLALAFLPKLGEHLPYYNSRYYGISFTLGDEVRAVETHAQFVRALHAGHGELGRTFQNLPVTALAPRVLPRRNWIEDLKRDDPRIRIADTIILFEGGWACPAEESNIRLAALPYEYRVPGTRITLLSRKTLAELPTFAPLLVEAKRRTQTYCSFGSVRDRDLR